MKFLIPDNDVIQDVHPDHFSGFNEFVCKGLIFRTGRSVSSRMIMRADDRHREVLEGALEDFADDGAGVVDGALFQVFDGNNTVLGIEEYDFEDFLLKVPHLRHEDINDVFGGFDLRALFLDLRLAKAAADFKRGFDLGNLGRAKSLQLLPIPGIRVAHVAECPELIQDLPG